MASVFLCLISLSILPPRSIHAAANGKTSFLFTAKQVSNVRNGMLTPFTAADAELHIDVD